MNLPGNICDGCGTQFTLEPSNTIIHYFDCQPWFSYGHATCPNCRQTARLFWRDQDYMDYFIIQDFPFEAADFADELTVSSFESVYSLRTVTEVSLTPRLEMEVHNLHTVLENVPDDLLLSLFEDPEPKHELPERWRNA